MAANQLITKNHNKSKMEINKSHLHIPLADVSVLVF